MLVGQNWWVYLKQSIGEHHLWAQPCFSSKSCLDSLRWVVRDQIMKNKWNNGFTISFRPYPISYSLLYSLIYFLFLINFRKNNFFSVEKVLSINKEIFWIESVGCVFSKSTVPFIFHHTQLTFHRVLFLWSVYNRILHPFLIPIFFSNHFIRN